MQVSKRKTQKYLCSRCLHYYHTQAKLDAHEEDCLQINKCRVDLPSLKENILQFKNFHYKLRVPFNIYDDFESLLESREYKKIYQQYKAFSIGYYFKCSYNDTLSYYRSYRGSQPAAWFAKELETLAENIETVHWCPIPMDTSTYQQELGFQNATTCHICEKFLGADRVHDHCHLTSKYRGPPHDKCNLNYQETHCVPVVFHNLTGYGSHFLIRDIAQNFPGRVNFFPLNKERFKSFTKRINGSEINYKFIDSFRFMPSSLEQYNILPSEFINDAKYGPLTEEKFNLLKRKGVFPYNYLDSEKKLTEKKAARQQSRRVRIVRSK